MDKDRNRSAAGLDRMRRGFQTTLPTAQGQDGQSMAGPAADPLEELLRQHLSKEAWATYCLTGVLSEEQLQKDGGAWFEQAVEYVNRVAILRDERADLFPDSPCTGDDLRSRLRRIRALERVKDEAQALVAATERSLKVERADVIALADMHVSDLDFRAQRPMLPERERADIMRVADFALTIWWARTAKIQATRRDNERAQLELDQARAEARAAQEAQPEAAPPKTDSRSISGPALPPPGRNKGRKTPR